MKKTLFLLIILVTNSLLAQADKDSLLARDARVLIEELRFMHGLDQGTRKYLDYGTFDRSFTDSIEGLGKEERQLAEESLKLSQATKDKLWDRFLSPLDSLKAVRMIEIIEKYGFPSGERLKKFGRQDVDFSSTTILVHTPFNLKDKMIPLLKREYEEGNLGDKCEYGYLLWHLNGRSDFKYMLENGYLMEKNADGTFNLVRTCD